MKIHLPTGGVLAAPSDPTNAAHTDCSSAFSLLPLIASYLASMQCLLKILAMAIVLANIACNWLRKVCGTHIITQ